MSERLENYVEVGERIRRFYERYPEGSLQAYLAPHLEHVGERTFIVYCAAAYRTPDDLRPGIGYAWELVPGPTPFTRDSELQNAETSAWGRAIAALGFETHNGVATREDVDRAQASAKDSPARTGDGAHTERGSTIGTSSPAYRKLRAITGKLDKLDNAQQPAPFADWWSSLVSDVDRVFHKDVRELTEEEAANVASGFQAMLDGFKAAAVDAEPDEEEVR